MYNIQSYKFGYVGRFAAIEAMNDQETYQGDPDVKAVSGLVHSINMAVSRLTAYPQGHPAIIESFGRAETIANAILDVYGHLSFGVARDALMMGNRILDEKSTIFRRFAAILFEHGIVGLTLQKGLAAQELLDFGLIISKKRNEVYRAGGINALISKARIRHVQLKLIDYGIFQAKHDLQDLSEDDLQSAVFWEGFVRRLFDGTLEAGSYARPWEDIAPGVLAQMLNDKYLVQGSEALAGLDSALLTNFQQAGVDQLADDNDARDRLFDFVGSLNNDLRQCFLERFLNALPDNNDHVAQVILSGLPDEMILVALKKHTDQELYAPPNVLQILQKLKKDRFQSEQDGFIIDDHSEDQMMEKLDNIFKENDDDRFVPLDYQRMLRDVMSNEDLSPDDFSEVHQLGKTLSVYNIEISITPVIVNLVLSHVNDELPESLKTTLKKHCIKLAANGDFHIIMNVLESVKEQLGLCGENEGRFIDEISEVFSSRDFMGEVLGAGTKWGKEKHFYMRRIIQHVGHPFIEPLLDRLAEEESKTSRLFYLDLLKDFGATVKEQLIRRLGDKRWYVVRNLLYVLRQLDDPSVLDDIYGLFAHRDQRVRQELLHVFLVFKDARADNILLQEMNSGNHERCVKAIGLAGMTGNQEVFTRLVEFVRTKGFKKEHLEIKKESIKALAAIANPAALPFLQKVLQSISLFSRQKLLSVKLDIIASMENYPSRDTLPLLRKIAASGRSKIAVKAGQLLKNVKGKDN